MRAHISIFLFWSLHIGFLIWLDGCAKNDVAPAPLTYLLSVDGASRVMAGACEILNIRYTSNFGNETPASEDIEVKLIGLDQIAYADAACSQKVSSVLLKTGSSRSPVYVRSTKVERVQFIPSSKLPGSTVNLQFVPASAKRFQIVGNRVIPVGACIKFEIASLDEFGNSEAPLSGTNKIQIAAENGVVYSDAVCSTLLGNNSQQLFEKMRFDFYFKSLKASTFDLDVSDDSKLVSEKVVVATMPSNGLKLSLSTESPKPVVGTCVPLKMGIRDKYDNAVPFSIGQKINLSTSTKDGATVSDFSLKPDCTEIIYTGSIVLSSEETSKVIFLKQRTAGSYRVLVDDSSLKLITGEVMVSLAPDLPYVTAITFTAPPAQTGNCEAAALVVFDKYYNKSPVGTATTFNLQVDALTGDELEAAYKDSNCSSPISQLVVAQNENSVGFYYVLDRYKYGRTMTAMDTTGNMKTLESGEVFYPWSLKTLGPFQFAGDCYYYSLFGVTKSGKTLSGGSYLKVALYSGYEKVGRTFPKIYRNTSCSGKAASWDTVASLLQDTVEYSSGQINQMCWVPSTEQYADDFSSLPAAARACIRTSCGRGTAGEFFGFGKPAGCD